MPPAATLLSATRAALISRARACSRISWPASLTAWATVSTAFSAFSSTLFSFTSFFTPSTVFEHARDASAIAAARSAAEAALVFFMGGLPLEPQAEGEHGFGVPLRDDLHLDVGNDRAAAEPDARQEVGGHVRAGHGRAGGVHVDDAQARSHPDEGAAVAVEVVVEVHVERHEGAPIPEHVLGVGVGPEVMAQGHDELDSGERLFLLRVETRAHAEEGAFVRRHFLGDEGRSGRTERQDER